MIDERPEALLKSALEKIVYFEARSEQLQNDLTAARGEAERLKRDLATAAQREIELRRTIAELEVRIARGHQEREELGRVNDALRVERTDLLEKLIEASRIDAADRENMADMFDLAGFIAQLRGEVINDAAATAVEKAKQKSRAEKAFSGDASTSPPSIAALAAPANAAILERPFIQASQGSDAGAALESARSGNVAAYEAGQRGLTAAYEAGQRGLTAAYESGQRGLPGGYATEPRATASVSPQLSAPAPRASGGVSAYAERLYAQGRLSVSETQMMALSSRTGVATRTEETLFGFSVRELAAPDPAARIRAAERLKSLQNPAAAHALATAIHSERDAEVQVVFIGAFTSLAQSEGAAIVTPLLSSPMPEVRISALKSLLTLDPLSAGPHLSAAMKDPNRAVRRRASLLALSLSGDAALRLGEEAIHDEDPEVRGLAALVLGAGSGEKARVLLLEALRDREPKVRQSAARALSRLLGTDVSSVVNLDDAQRRREVRRLASLPLRPVLAGVKPAAARVGVEQLEAGVDRARPAAVRVEVEQLEPLARPTAARVEVAAEVEPLRQELKRRIEPEAVAVRADAYRAERGPGNIDKLALPHQGELAPGYVEELVPSQFDASAAPASKPMPEGPRAFDEALCDQLVTEVRCAIRGRTMAELTNAISRPPAVIEEACDLLVARGQLLRRGLKFFFA